MKNYIMLLALMFGAANVWSQEYEAPTEKTINNTTGLWTGLYTKYRVSEKTFYYGEYHFRRRNNFINDMAQIYLRFGMTYLLNKNIEITGGIVTPFYWAPDYKTNDEIDKVVPQFRFWEQVLLVQPLERIKLYHQFRIEQRWKRDYEPDSPFVLSHRFRYRFTAYYPLNNKKLVPKTLYLSFYDEIFIQAGKKVKYDHFEDNRVFLGLGYILNENIQIQAGYMWTFRHDGSPYTYESRHIPRISLYHNFDFYGRKKKQRELKPIMLEDNL